MAVSVEGLASAVKGRVVEVGAPDYDEARALYSEGLSATEIADVFVISPHTVRTHVKNAYRRLGIHSREEAARVIHAERFLELV